MSTGAKPRLLLLTQKWKFLNKTQDVFYNSLDEYFEVIRYGPGYVPIEDIKEDMGDILREVGSVDCVVVDPLLFFNYLNPKTYANHKRSRKYYFDIKKFCYRKSRFPQGLETLKVPVAVALLRSDYYNFTRDQIDRMQRLCLAKKDSYFISFDREIIKMKQQLPELHNESFAEYANDNMAGFVRKYPDRIIPFVHMVGEEEFTFRKKKRTLSVPGAQYYFRKLVKRYLKKAGIKYHAYSLLNIILTFLDIKKLITISKSGFLMDIYYRSFRNLIAVSRISFTEGSRLRWPIRKYFEIPAFGSLLLCEPCSGFERLGFLDNVNCITVTEPSQVPEKINYLAKNRKEAEMIAEAGQKFVLEKHSGKVRARQFRNIFDLIRKNMFKKAYWENGDICCDDMSGNKVKV